jgi:hypothetical protein
MNLGRSKYFLLVIIQVPNREKLILTFLEHPDSKKDAKLSSKTCLFMAIFGSFKPSLWAHLTTRFAKTFLTVETNEQGPARPWSPRDKWVQRFSVSRLDYF